MDTKRPAIQTVQGSVYASMRSSIRNLNLLPGTVISETEVSLMYKVSRTPVREAFIRLSKEALIKVIPQKETQISLIDLDRVKQERFLRESLEMAILPQFIECSRPVHFANLQEIMQQQIKAFESSEMIKFMYYDDLFHKTFFDVAGQGLSGELLDSMNGHYFRVRMLSIWLNGVAYDIVNQHQSLCEALRSKDLASAKEILERHLHKINTEEKMLLEKFPNYFVNENAKDTFNVDFGGFQIS